MIRLLLLLLVLPQFVYAQYTTSGEEEINKLKNGAVVVRLYMNKPKTDILTKSIKGAENAKEQKQLQKQLDDHLSDREKYKAKTIKAFKDNYTFSKIYYVYDYNIHKLKEGTKSGIFLNTSGEIDNTISMSEEDYLVFARGQNDDSVILQSNDGRQLPAAFPTQYNRGVGSIFSILFSPKDKLAESIVKIDKALFKYLVSFKK
jgi:hypothetical protein